MAEHDHDVLPLSESERAEALAALNAARPLARRKGLEEWHHADVAWQRSEAVGLRLVGGHPVAGVLEVEDAATTTQREPGIVEGELYVAPDARCQGIGTALYARAEAFAHERNATTLKAWFYQDGAEGPGSAFLRRRGFAEYQRRITSHLDLTAFDATRFAERVAAVERGGVRLFGYDETSDVPERRRRLYELFGAFHTLAPFEQWEAVYFGDADRTDHALLLAEVEGRWVGLTSLVPFNRAAGVARIALTGTLPECRGHGIATVLKVRAAALARARGARTLVTANRVENAPILAANRALGFVPGALELTYSKTLEA